MTGELGLWKRWKNEILTDKGRGGEGEMGRGGE